jgi:phosphotriesterase-related protein
VTIENLGFVRWNLLALEDNLRLDQPDVAVTELGRVAAVGGSGVVDLTVEGLGPSVAQLPAIARATGLHLMVGCGFYIARTHPHWLVDSSIEAIADFLEHQLADGIGDTGIRPALVGLIGTSDPIGRSEERVLRGAARAAAAAGAAMNVRLDPAARHGLRVLSIIGSEGLSPERVVFGNVDEYLDPPYLRALADEGATLELCFGSDFYYRAGYKDPTDAERFGHLLPLLEAGYARRLVLGCSVWTKAHLRAYGGMGYDHLLRRIVPELIEAHSVDSATIDRMLVENPRRLLDRDEQRGRL